MTSRALLVLVAVLIVADQAAKEGVWDLRRSGLEKVKAIALWYALAHNMACTWRLVWT